MKYKVKPDNWVSFYLNQNKNIIDKDNIDDRVISVESRVIAVAIDLDEYVVDMFVEPIQEVKSTDFCWNRCHSDQLRQRAKVGISKGRILVSDDLDIYDNKLVINLKPNHITGLRVKLSPDKDFCKCESCENIVHMAAPNQPDGKTFICYSCRQNPIRKFY